MRVITTAGIVDLLQNEVMTADKVKKKVAKAENGDFQGFMAFFSQQRNLNEQSRPGKIRSNSVGETENVVKLKKGLQEPDLQMSGQFLGWLMAKPDSSVVSLKNMTAAELNSVEKMLKLPVSRILKEIYRFKLQAGNGKKGDYDFKTVSSKPAQRQDNEENSFLKLLAMPLAEFRARLTNLKPDDINLLQKDYNNLLKEKLYLLQKMSSNRAGHSQENISKMEKIITDVLNTEMINSEQQRKLSGEIGEHASRLSPASAETDISLPENKLKSRSDYDLNLALNSQKSSNSPDRGLTEVKQTEGINQELPEIVSEKTNNLKANTDKTVNQANQLLTNQNNTEINVDVKQAQTTQSQKNNIQQLDSGTGKSLAKEITVKDVAATNDKNTDQVIANAQSQIQGERKNIISKPKISTNTMLKQKKPVLTDSNNPDTLRIPDKSRNNDFFDNKAANQKKDINKLAPVTRKAKDTGDGKVSQPVNYLASKNMPDDARRAINLRQLITDQKQLLTYQKSANSGRQYGSGAGTSNSLPSYLIPSSVNQKTTRRTNQGDFASRPAFESFSVKSEGLNLSPGIKPELTSAKNHQEYNPIMTRLTSLNNTISGDDTGSFRPGLQSESANFNLELTENNSRSKIETAQIINQASWENLLVKEEHKTSSNKLNTQPKRPQTDIVEQVNRQIKSFQRLGKHQLEIRLEPESLGRVKLNLKVIDGQVTLDFKVENLLVKQQLEQNLHMLRDNFIRQGYNVDHVQVETEDHGSNFQQQQSQQNSQQQSEQQQNNHSQNQSEDFREISRELMVGEDGETVENLPVTDLLSPQVSHWMMSNQQYSHMNILA